MLNVKHRLHHSEQIKHVERKIEGKIEREPEGGNAIVAMVVLDAGFGKFAPELLRFHGGGVRVLW